MSVTSNTGTVTPVVGSELTVATIADGPFDRVTAFVKGGTSGDGKSQVTYRLYAVVGSLTALIAESTVLGSTTSAILQWQTPGSGAAATQHVDAGGTSYVLTVVALPTTPQARSSVTGTLAGVNVFDTAANQTASSVLSVAAFGETSGSNVNGYCQFMDVSLDQTGLPQSTTVLVYASNGTGSVETVVTQVSLSGPDGVTAILRQVELPVASVYRVAVRNNTSTAINVPVGVATYSIESGGSGGGVPVDQQFLPSLDSRVLNDISSDDWTRNFPTLAYVVQTNDPVGTPSSNECNPYRDAPTNGLRSWKFVTASDETHVTFSVTMRRVPGDANETPALVFLDATGGVVLAQLNPLLTDDFTTYSVSLTTTPNTYYLCVLAMNNPTLGTSVQARALVTDVTLSGNSQYGVFVGQYTRLHVSPKSAADNAEPITNVTEYGYIKSAFARNIVRTTASHITVEYFSTLQQGGFTNQGNLLVMVNGRPYETIVPTGNGAPVYVDIVLPPPPAPNTDNLVEIVEASNFSPYPTMLVTSVRAIYVPSEATTSLPGRNPARKMSVYGDSIDLGYFLVPASLIGWATRARQWFPGNVQLECYGGRRLYDDQTGTGGFTALAQKISRYDPDTIYVTIGINDQNNPGPGETVASFQTQYGNMLAAMHAWNPRAQIVCAVPLVTGTEDVPNVNGDFVRDFREAIIVAANAAGSFASVSWRSGAVTPAMLNVSVHPNNEGTDRMQRYDQGALGLGAVQLPAVKVTDPVPTLLERWQAIPSSVTLTLGLVSAWTGLVNGHVLSQGSAVNRPAFAAAGGPNGFGALQFRNATSSFLQWAAGVATPNPLWVQIVLKMAAIGAPGVKDVILDGAVGVASLVLATDNTPQTYIGTAGTNVVIATALATAKWNIVNGIFNLGASEIDIEFAQTAGPILQHTGATLATTPNGLTVGALQSGAGRGADFDVVEISLYDGVAPTAQEWNVQIEARLKALYQL